MTNYTRIFPPGSNCVYFKLYNESLNSDKLLLKIKPQIHKCIENGFIRSFFFIRYADPNFHIRLRLFLTKAEYLAQVINILNTVLVPEINRHFIKNIELATYKREIERYGHKFIALSEDIFYYDSLLFFEILDLEKKFNCFQNRWIIGIKIVDDFLNSVNIPTNLKYNIMEILSQEYFKEFKVDKALKKQINLKYRENYSSIVKFINNNGNIVFNQKLTNCINKKNENIKKSFGIHNISTCMIKSNFSFITSHIHMFLNRLFRANNRLHELVIYTFLKKFYNSVLKKQ